MSDQHGDASGAGGRSHDDAHLEQLGEQFGTIENDDPPQLRWEELTRARLGFQEAPFTVAMDYALGLVLWPAASPRPQPVPSVEPDDATATTHSAALDMPLVCLVALALYATARDSKVYDIGRAGLRSARDMLADPALARGLATERPGVDHKPDGRLRDTDHQALLDMVADADDQRWEHLRARALHVFAAHLQVLDWPGNSAPDVFLYLAIGHVRHTPVRRSWYEHPVLTPVVGPHDDPAECM